jgi:4-hydroxybenzoate polyprenyltransferase
MEQADVDSSLAALSEVGALERPLCVSLEGGLVRSDLLWESVLRLVRKRPSIIFLLPLWILGGRARVLREVRQRLPFDAAVVPYRGDLVKTLRASVAKGRRLVLFTRGEPQPARALAEHLGLFDEVVGADGADFSLARQREALKARFGATGFDYVGGSAADLPLVQDAQHGYLVGVTHAVAQRAHGQDSRIQVLSTRPSVLRAVVKVTRPHQWAKNALVFVPVLLTYTRPSLAQLAAAVVATVSFCLCASAGYVFNDLLDVEADRAHRTKHRRPFASGDLPLVFGPPLFLALFVASFGLAAALLPPAFLGMLGFYFVATLTYSLVLKSTLLLDVVLLAWLYTHRVLSGGVATGIPISAWLLAFSMFMFASLALAKRYIELRQSMNKASQLKSRGYHTHDLEMVASMGPTAGYIAVLVFCLYVDSRVVEERYHLPMLLWFVAPVLLYWISRVWFLAHRGQMQDDPVKFALTDRGSWICALLVALIAAAARLWPR